MTGTGVLIRGITHGLGHWGKDERGRVCDRTRCGILYTRAAANLDLPFGESVEHRSVDCMACLVGESR